MKLFRFGTHERNVIFLEGGGEEEYNDDSRQLLIDMKCKIDRYDIQMWERSKKSNNDYEYIYTSSRNNKALFFKQIFFISSKNPRDIGLTPPSP